MPRPPYAKRKRAPGSVLREAALAWWYRRSRVDGWLDYDWARVEADRASVVSALIKRTGGGEYLEIGCADNLLFDRVEAARKVGVDPERGGTHRMTSDAFFAQNSDRFDVIFIDGLHHYHQVRRDLANALAAVRQGGWIALHDMLPRDWIEEHVPPLSTSRWTGDGWKTAFELMDTPGLDFRLAAVDHGVGIVRPLSEDLQLADRSRELGPLRFAWFRDHLGELPLVEWAEAERWIETA